MRYLLAFGSTHKAMKAESVLVEHKVEFRLEPAPKALANYCALVITVEEELLSETIRLLNEACAGAKAVYRKSGEDYVEV